MSDPIDDWISPGIRWRMLFSDGIRHNALDPIAHTPIRLETFDSARIASRGEVVPGDPMPMHELKSNPPTILTTHRFCDVYYHWLFDILPRVRQAIAILGESCLITLPFPRFRFQTEWLALVAPRVAVSFFSEPRLHLSGPVVVPSESTSGTVAAPWGIRAVQQVAQHIPPTVGKPYVYIQRRGAVLRQIVNAEELERMLAREGFVAVDLATLTVTEQISLFRGAKTIVAAHGSSMANLIFCQPGCSVIEIFGPSCGETCYPRIAHQMQLRHLGVQATEVGYLGLNDRYRHLLKRNDAPFHFKVDTALIQQALALIV